MATQPNHNYFAQARATLARNEDIAALWREWLASERKPAETPPIPSLWLRFAKWAKGTQQIDVNASISRQGAPTSDKEVKDCPIPGLDASPSQTSPETAIPGWKHGFTQVEALGSAFASLLETYVRAVAREEARALIAEALELSPEEITA